jgi:SAM-dependent methyltransferase
MSEIVLPDLGDFYRHRWAINAGDGPEKETEQYWNQRAAEYAVQVHSTTCRAETERFLDRFSWEKNETVLDVAAGPGTFAVPLASRVREIVAVDFSSAMLQELRLRAEKEDRRNIRTIGGRWLEIEPPGVFDTVLCLNGLGVITVNDSHESRLDLALTKLKDCVGRRLVIQIPHADSSVSFAIRSIFGNDEPSPESRRIGILYYAMVDCGILADLEILSQQRQRRFASPEDACRHFVDRLGGGSASPGQIEKLRRHLAASLQQNHDGTFTLYENIKQALFVWNRN